MAGHNKWSKIKRKKGDADAKRSKIFTKIIKELTIAARMGGGDPDGNPRLRLAMEKAKAESMPKDNIERAIKKGTGDLGGENIEEVTYEGYGPAGVAVLVDCTTDNKNRTVADVRSVFSKRGGSMGENGSVSWMFEKKGQIVVDGEGFSEEDLFEKAIEAGAEDLTKDDGGFLITTSFEDFHSVNESLAKLGVVIQSADIQMVPKNTIKIDDVEVASKLLTLVEILEDNDDVQNVWANFEMDDEVMEKVSEL